MKNYGTVTVPKGTVGYESENGHNNWWYPDRSSPRELPMNVLIKHLHLWRNQGPFYVFAVPLCVFKPVELFEEKGRKQYITLWFHEEDIDAIVDRQAV